MKLFEFEGKQLFQKYKISIPMSTVFSKEVKINLLEFKQGYAVKAQVTAGKRGVSGGVVLTHSKIEAEQAVHELFSKKIHGFPVEHVLVEEKQNIECMYYFSITYDTVEKCPVLSFSKNGGIDIEKMVDLYRLDIPIEYNSKQVLDWLNSIGLQKVNLSDLEQLICQAFTCFLEEDLRVLEINPLVFSQEQKWIACDSKILTDDDAQFRHKERIFPSRNEFGKIPTIRELQAKEIDQDDYRGVGGKYTELTGNIAMLTAGGGASLTNMDALLAYGGKPANYTEYGGNPPQEKVYKLTKVILSKPGLVGCWHVGGTANNTQIDVTMKGFALALEEIKPEYPIVVRRDGPNSSEGFRILEETAKKLKLNLKWFDKNMPMTESAEVLMKMVKEYQKKKGLN
ncbi:MAG: ATP citrate lyase citrate-binding domain-containing protein [Candidatus Diapherotrites archaeon]|nr:ATP citrate lyase citrate-binding domain-containing protein [Candidatus Diapherotrites archaeon]